MFSRILFRLKKAPRRSIHSTPGPLESLAPELFEDILNRGLSLRVKATGASMAPFLLGGEVVTIRKAPFSSFRRGDLVFFKNSRGFLTLHRMIGKRNGEEAIRTKGDALASPDEPVARENILGKVYEVETIDPIFGSGRMDMESNPWKTINLLIALIHLVKSTKVRRRPIRREYGKRDNSWKRTIMNERRNAPPPCTPHKDPDKTGRS